MDQFVGAQVDHYNSPATWECSLGANRTITVTAIGKSFFISHFFIFDLLLNVVTSLSAQKQLTSLVLVRFGDLIERMPPKKIAAQHACRSAVRVVINMDPT